MFTIHAILHPTDFSEAADEALHVACSLARDHNAKLVLVATPALPPPPHKYSFPPGQAEYATEVRAVKQRLATLAKSITEIPVETMVPCGLPGPSILAAADEHHADLIAMGTHGRTGVARLLLGSTAEYVMRHAHCPVLAMRCGTGEHLGHEVETALSVSASARDDRVQS